MNVVIKTMRKSQGEDKATSKKGKRSVQKSKKPVKHLPVTRSRK